MASDNTIIQTGTPVTLSTGITVYARKVSLFTMDAVRQSIPRPVPPLATNTYGPDDVRQEPNEADPAYLAAVKQWEDAVNLRAADAILRLGVRADINPAALAELRAAAEVIGITLPADDQMAYIKHIAIAGEDDLTAIQHAVMQRSGPTPEAVASHAETFRSDVQGPPTDEYSAAEVGAGV